MPPNDGVQNAFGATDRRVARAFDRRSDPTVKLYAMTDVRSLQFDGFALWNAMDVQREERGLSWSGVLAAMSASEHELAAKLGELSRPVAAETIARIRQRGDCGCHHAIGYLKWLQRTPESFLIGIDEIRHEAPLPESGPGRRVRWDIPGLAVAVTQRKRELGLTWKQIEQDHIDCYPNQVSGLHRLRYGTGMTLTMRLAQWLDRSAASFMILTEW